MRSPASRSLPASSARSVGRPARSSSISLAGVAPASPGLHISIGLPMNLLVIPKGEPSLAEKAPAQEAAPSRISWTMIGLAGLFGATWCVATALAAHLPRLLQAMGVATTTAIFAASLVGPAQVAARLVELLNLPSCRNFRR